MPARALAATLALIAGLTVPAAAAQEAPHAMVGSPRVFAVTRGVPFQTSVATFTDSDLGAVRDTAAFVDQVFRDMLGRPADASGSAYWTFRIEQGAGRLILPYVLVSTSEWAGNVVTQLYEDPAYLDRTPDPAETAYWAGVLSGASINSLRAAILGSSEWVDAHGGTGDPEAVVNGLYQVALGRPADESGLAYFAGLLDAGTSAATVANQLLLSAEGLGHTIDRRWVAFLGRNASPGEVGAWVGIVAQPVGEVFLLIALAASDEYYNRLPSDYTATVKWGTAAPVAGALRRAGGNAVAVVAANVLAANADDLPVVVTVTRTGLAPVEVASSVDVVGSRNERWLDAVYQDMIGRPVDADGLAFWLAWIASGGSRTKAAPANLLTTSPEWDANVVRKWFEDADYLGRAPTASEITQYSTVGLVTLRASLLASGEYFGNHGSSNGTWVDALFESVLHRPADPDGRAYFLSLLDGGTDRYTVALIVLASGEALLAEAGDLYLTYLDRSASPGEAAGMAAVLTNGSEAGALVLIVLSGEYYDHFPIASAA